MNAEEAETPQASSPEPDSPQSGEEYEVAEAAAEAKGKLPQHQWMLDSGASAHITD